MPPLPLDQIPDQIDAGNCQSIGVRKKYILKD
jgi:hypothetical protein